jgi:glycosyltransferase involved in cell wall biosynthesis
MLSIIIPVFNERPTLWRVLASVARSLPGVAKEIVIVDDYSTDGTREWLRATFPEQSCPFAAIKCPGPGEITLVPAVQEPANMLHVIYHERNRGKGGALQSGLAAASGEIIVIQDADLEYDPADWTEMYDLIALRQVADVVYGSRFYGRPHRSLYFHHYLGNRLISYLFNALYNQTLSDIEVCYKMFTRAVKEELRRRFRRRNRDQRADFIGAALPHLRSRDTVFWSHLCRGQENRLAGWPLGFVVFGAISLEPRRQE